MTDVHNAIRYPSDDKRQARRADLRRGAAAGPGTGRRILVICEDALVPDGCDRIGAGGAVTLVAAKTVDAGMLAEMRPDVVLSPLFTATFDSMDVIQTLADAGYTGAYRAIARDLPAPALIRAELQGIGRGMDIDLIEGSRLEELIA